MSYTMYQTKIDYIGFFSEEDVMNLFNINKPHWDNMAVEDKEKLAKKYAEAKVTVNVSEFL